MSSTHQAAKPAEAKEVSNDERKSLVAESARLRQENKSMYKYRLGYQRNVRVTGPNGSPLYCEAVIRPDGEYYEDCCDGNVDGEFDKWYAGRCTVPSGTVGIPLSKLASLEYHIEGFHPPITLEECSPKFTLTVHEDDSKRCSFGLDNHIFWLLGEKAVAIADASIADSTWKLTEKLQDRWTIKKERRWGGPELNTAKLEFEVEQAEHVIKELFGDSDDAAMLNEFSLNFDMNEAGGSRFICKYDPNQKEETPASKEGTLAELKEENTRLKAENKRLLSYKNEYSRSAKITGSRNDSPVYCKGEVICDGAWNTTYEGILHAQPRVKGVPFHDIPSLKIHVDGEKRPLALADYGDRLRCTLTCHRDGKWGFCIAMSGLSLESDDSFPVGVIDPTVTSQWPEKKIWLGAKECKVTSHEFSWYEMKKVWQDVFQSDSKVRVRFNQLYFSCSLFEYY